MALDEELETEILLRNALRLGVSSRARDAAALAAAIGERLGALGFRNSATCAHCRRAIPDFSICPYCSAPRGAPAEALTPAVTLREHFSFDAVGGSLTRPYFWGITGLAVAPMVLKFVGLGEKWMFIYFSLFWAYLFFRVTHTRRTLWRAGAFGYVFTGLFALPALVAWISAPPHLSEALVGAENGLVRLVGFVVGIGLREEVAKIIGVVWLARFTLGNRRMLTTPVEAMIVGSLSGLGFAAIENIDYLERFQFLDKIHYTFGQYADNLSFRGSMSRVMLTPFVHAVWSGILAYFVFLALSLRGRNRARLATVGLAMAAGLHGLYNFFTSVPGADLFVIVVVAVSFAVWLACYEKGRLAAALERS